MISAFNVIAGLTMKDVAYQLTGMAVVFCCLVFLCIILSISGAVATRMEAKSKAKAEAAKAAAKPAPAPAPKPAAPAPVVPAGPVVVGAQEMSPEHIAALAAGIYQAVSNSITPEVVVAIAAAIRYTLGNEYRILEIKPVTPAFAEAGRAANMTNHFPVRSIVRR
ncbi:MAG: OadG family transporter subunit [Akkermansia sp.]